jgi:hypothetical protein
VPLRLTLLPNSFQVAAVAHDAYQALYVPMSQDLQFEQLLIPGVEVFEFE